MAEILLMGDLHLSDRPPSSCTETYLDDLFDLLEASIELARERDVVATVWAGDVFHHKTPGRTSHSTVRRLIDLAGRCRQPVLVVPGNHDLSNDRVRSLDEGQPLGVLFASGAVQMLDGPVSWSGLQEDMVMYGVPWLQRFDDESVADAFRDWRRLVNSDRPALVVAHAPLYPLGRELPYEFYSASKWAEAMGNRGSVYYGHVHDPAGTYTVDGVTFCNPGALSRGSLDEHNLNRPVQVATWDTDTGQFELHTLPHKPSSEVFRIAEVRERRQAQVSLDNFLASIGTTTLEVTSVESVLTHLRTVLADPDDYSLAQDLLEAAAPA